MTAGILRTTIVLKHYRGFVLPEGDRFRAYFERVLAHPAVRRTCSTEELYLESYERYVLAAIAPVVPGMLIYRSDTRSTDRTRANTQTPSTRELRYPEQSVCGCVWHAFPTDGVIPYGVGTCVHR